MKKIFVIGLIEDYFNAFKSDGIISRAIKNKKFDLEFVFLRNFTQNSYKNVDSPSYGGVGMTLRADVFKKALESIAKPYKVICPAPRGRIWNHEEAKKLAQNFQQENLVFICGRYQGIDERFLELYVDEFYSVGDFVLTGGEIPVLTILDSFLRLVPGVLGNEESLRGESFSEGYLQGPTYTKPSLFEGKEVPEVLLSGHHKKIQEFHEEKSLEWTKKYRKDLL